MVDGHMSDPATVRSGVPQGTVLGPLLFLLFIYDIPSDISSGTRLRLFADDCLMYHPIYGMNDQLTLQRDIDKLMDWADRWGMYFNASKCNVMVTLGRIHSERFYHMKGQILKEVLHAKYLGVTPSRYLAWRSHMDSVIAKANQTLGFVKRNLRGAPLHSRITAYFAIVRAGLEYAAPIWDPYLRKDIDALEIVQRKAARWVKSQYFFLTMSASPASWPNWNGLHWRTVDVSPSCASYIRYTQVQWIWALRYTSISIILHVLLALDPGLIPTDN